MLILFSEIIVSRVWLWALFPSTSTDFTITFHCHVAICLQGKYNIVIKVEGKYK